MEEIEFPTTAQALGGRFGAEVVGRPDVEIRTLSALDSAGPGSLSFFANRKYAESLSRVSGAVVFTSADLVRRDLPVTFLIVDNPQSAFAQVAKRFTSRFSWSGISSQAIVHPSAEIAPDAHVGPFCVIEEGARIGAGTRVHPYCYIGRGVTVGTDCQLFPRVTLLEGVTLGRSVKILAGSVLGSEGFGFFQAQGESGRSEMPQIGTVIIEDEVRIGANCTIDRGTLGETRIGFGVKIDDQVHVGHNCRVGAYSVLCAQVGLGGSAILEDDVILGGQAGVGHGVILKKGVRLGGQGGATSNLNAGTYFMTPAVPIKDTVRMVKYMRKLPQIWERLKKLELLLEGKNG